MFLLAALWVGWLLFDGLTSGEIWVKGGSKDRFTRALDMHSFAHKVSRQDNPLVYWFNVVLYLIFIGLLLWLFLKG